MTSISSHSFVGKDSSLVPAHLGTHVLTPDPPNAYVPSKPWRGPSVRGQADAKYPSVENPSTNGAS